MEWIPVWPFGPKAGDGMKWCYRPWIVVVLLFFVLGPFGLPLLYKSPKFSKGWKWGFTILTLCYTGYLVWATVKTMEALSGSLAQLQAVLG